MERSWAAVPNVSLLVAIGVKDEGFRELQAVPEESEEASWKAFLRYLKERGLKDIRLFVSGECLPLVESIGEF